MRSEAFGRKRNGQEENGLKRRMLALLLAVTALLGLGACGGASGDEKEDASSVTGELPAEEADRGDEKESDRKSVV